ncbi:MAG: ABC transporter permease [Pirellulales bacterium]|nr:ABC transporter permease [Pirellulales bacterium]
MLKKILLTLRLGFFSLLLHKMRSSLAVLGIMIGVTAVIWLVALGEGVSQEAQRQIKDLGATNIIVKSVKPAAGSSADEGARFLPYGILREDYDRLLGNIPWIRQAVPMREISREFRHRARSHQGQLVGCTGEYLELNQLSLWDGRFINADDQKLLANYCVIAQSVAEQLFPTENPINQSLQIDSDFYQIIGITADRDPSAAIGGSLAGRDYNSDVYIPLETLRARIGDQVMTGRSNSMEGEIVELSQITIGVANIEQVDHAADIIRELLSRNHPNEDYAVIVPKELLRQAENMRMMFNALLILIAGISLLVGGIGIMNIMLATVTERTREIGIRRALGATRADIIQQFLVESVVLTGIGGALGVAVGFFCKPATNSIRKFLNTFFPDSMASVPASIQNLEPQVAYWSVAVAFGISVGVGLLFGLYPARRAAMMDPIEALRHE